MVKELLNKYKADGEFLFKFHEQLGEKCNAPSDKGGVYLVFDNLTREIIYIGCSGWICQDGSFKLRKGGMCDRIVNGKQFGIPRKRSWPLKMKEDGINEIMVKWYVTFDNDIKDIPGYVEACCLQKF